MTARKCASLNSQALLWSLVLKSLLGFILSSLNLSPWALQIYATLRTVWVRGFGHIPQDSFLLFSNHPSPLASQSPFPQGEFFLKGWKMTHQINSSSSSTALWVSMLVRTLRVYKQKHHPLQVNISSKNKCVEKLLCTLHKNRLFLLIELFACLYAWFKEYVCISFLSPTWILGHSGKCDPKILSGLGICLLYINYI